MNGEGAEGRQRDGKASALEPQAVGHAKARARDRPTLEECASRRPRDAPLAPPTGKLLQLLQVVPLPQEEGVNIEGKGGAVALVGGVKVGLQDVQRAVLAGAAGVQGGGSRAVSWPADGLARLAAVRRETTRQGCACRHWGTCKCAACAEPRDRGPLPRRAVMCAPHSLAHAGVAETCMQGAVHHVVSAVSACHATSLA